MAANEVKKRKRPTVRPTIENVPALLHAACKAHQERGRGVLFQILDAAHPVVREGYLTGEELRWLPGSEHGLARWELEELVTTYAPDTDFVFVVLEHVDDLKREAIEQDLIVGTAGCRIRLIKHVRCDDQDNKFHDLQEIILLKKDDPARPISDTDWYEYLEDADVDDSEELAESSFGCNAEDNMPPTASKILTWCSILKRWDGYGQRLKDLLTYFEPGDPGEWEVAKDAWRKAGLPKDRFQSGSYRDVIRVLEAQREMEQTLEKIREEVLLDLGSLQDPQKAAVNEALRRNSFEFAFPGRGKPEQPKLNVAKFNALCAEAGLRGAGQKAVAHELGISIDALQDGLRGKAGWNSMTFEAVAIKLGEKMKPPRMISPEDLKGIPD